MRQWKQMGMSIVLAVLLCVTARAGFEGKKAEEVKDKPAKVTQQAVPAPAKAAVKAEEPKKDANIEKNEKIQREMKGVQNQQAWVDTLQKQVDSEKGKLTQMQDEIAKEHKLDGEKFRKGGYTYDSAKGMFVEK